MKDNNINNFNQITYFLVNDRPLVKKSKVFKQETKKGTINQITPRK